MLAIVIDLIKVPIEHIGEISSMVRARAAESLCKDDICIKCALLIFSRHQSAVKTTIVKTTYGVYQGVLDLRFMIFGS